MVLLFVVIDFPGRRRNLKKTPAQTFFFNLFLVLWPFLSEFLILYCIYFWILYIINIYFRGLLFHSVGPKTTIFCYFIDTTIIIICLLHYMGLHRLISSISLISSILDNNTKILVNTTMGYHNDCYYGVIPIIKNIRLRYKTK